MRPLLLCALLVSTLTHCSRQSGSPPQAPAMAQTPAAARAVDAGQPALPPTDAEVARGLQQACEQKEARACTTLGTLTWQGRGVKANPRAAHALYLRGCEAGDAAGCFSAAICHRTGSCAEKSAQKARALLERGCKGGDARACDALGTSR